MYRQQLVWTGYGWESVTVFVPVTTGIYTGSLNGYYNGLYPFAGIRYAIPGNVVAASYAVSGR
jgi:hypothetical protein